MFMDRRFHEISEKTSQASYRKPKITLINRTAGSIKSKLIFYKKLMQMGHITTINKRTKILVEKRV